MGHDAFVRSLTNITEEALQSRIEARNAAIAGGEDVKPIDRSRYRQRLDALIPSAGPAPVIKRDDVADGLRWLAVVIVGLWLAGLLSYAATMVRSRR